MFKNLAYLHFLLLTVTLQVSNHSHAQETAYMDSVMQIVSITSPEKLVSVFDNIDKELSNAPNGKALSAAFYALSFARNNKLITAQVLAMRNIGAIYNHRIGNRDESLRYYQQALTLATEYPEDKFTLAVAEFNLGDFLSQQGLLSDGLKHILDAAKIFEELKLYSYVTLCHYQGCMINYTARNYQQSIEEGYRVLTYHSKLAPEEVNEGSEFQRMSIYNTIALAHSVLKQYELAIEHFERSEEIARKLHNEFWIGLINGNKGVVLKNLGKDKEAISSLQEDFITSKKYAMWGSAGRAAVAMSEIYTELNQYALAQHYLDSAKTLFSREKGRVAQAQGMSSYWMGYSKLKSATNHYLEAYVALSHHVDLRDSLYQEQEALNLAKVKASYDLDQKQSEIELLTQNSLHQEEHLRSQRTIFIATLLGLILLTLLAINLIYNYRRQRKIMGLIREQHAEIEVKNTELEAQSTLLQENNQYIHSLNFQLEQKVADRTRALEVANQELDTFLYRSSHDMRRPITTLLGLELVARHVIADTQSGVLFDKVVETARNMDSMLFKMQMMYELNRELPAESIGLKPLLEDVLKLFQADMDRYAITNNVSMPEDIAIYANRTLLQIIFRNLAENSILFRKTQPGAVPYVDISIEQHKDHITISVTDNGIGVEDRYQPQIFDLYFRASQASKGNGLGLYLTKKAVEKLGGHITFNSDYGVGTTVQIVLPIVT